MSAVQFFVLAASFPEVSLFHCVQFCCKGRRELCSNIYMQFLTQRACMWVRIKWERPQQKICKTDVVKVQGSLAERYDWNKQVQGSGTEGWQIVRKVRYNEGGWRGRNHARGGVDKPFKTDMVNGWCMAKKFSNRWGRTAEENFRTEEVERLNGCVISTIQFSGFASFPAPTELSGKMETSSHGDTSYSHATPQFCLRTEKKKICGTREPEQTGLGTVINQSI